MTAKTRASLLVLAGAVMLSVAGALVAVPLGLAVAGVYLVVAGLVFVDVDNGKAWHPVKAFRAWIAEGRR